MTGDVKPLGVCPGCDRHYYLVEEDEKRGYRRRIGKWPVDEVLVQETRENLRMLGLSGEDEIEMQIEVMKDNGMFDTAMEYRE
jgi:hypothetical protein